MPTRSTTPLNRLSDLLRHTPFVPSRPDRVILEIDLDRGVLRQAPDNPLAAMRSLNAASMRALRDGLSEAASDDRVRGLILHIGTCPLTPTQHDELGDLVEAFGDRKPTIAYSETFGELGNALMAYRLASRAQQVWLQPTGGLGLFGVHLEIVLLRGGLAKLGVEMQMSKRHEYKTAADQFAAIEVSPANREMTARIADSIVDVSVEAIARRRGVDVDAVRDAMANSPLSATEALERHLVDRLGYRDEVYAFARSSWEVPVPEDAEHDETLRFVHRYGRHASPLAGLAQRLTPTRPGEASVAVVPVHGGIAAGRSQQAGAVGATAGADEVCEHLRAAGRDRDVRAVILRVDSPGGSYTASDQIWRQVHLLREQGTPVVASMGDVAASGGYFVAMAATEIVANPTTLTGSIGVFAGKAVTRGLFDRLGLVREAVERGPRAGMLRGDDEFTPDEWEVLNRWLDAVYDDFTHKAASDRGLAHAVLEPLARGRVWTGADAKQHGLVDHLGGMDAAIGRACALADLDRDHVSLRAVPSIPLLSRFRPASSSESVGRSSVPSAGHGSLGWAGAGTIAGAMDAVGWLTVPPGVLTCPWRITVG